MPMLCTYGMPLHMREGGAFMKISMHKQYLQGLVELSAPSWKGGTQYEDALSLVYRWL